MEHERFGQRLQLRVGMAREMPGSDILKQGYLKKLKTMKKKYFVLRSTSSSGPARFDYHDSEKKFKASHPPKRSIPLHECFNINKKSDTKHKFAIALYLMNDSFSVIADDEEEQNRWLNIMLEYQNEFLLEGEIQKVHYDYVWQGIIKQKTPQSCPSILGPYRLCLSEKSVCLVKVNEFKPSYDFMLSSIRCCGHRDNFFFMEVGRSAVTGPGELWMQVEETSIAQGMHDQVLSGMTSRQSDFRGRSNTGGSTISRRSTIHGDDPPFIRKRATSESHHGQGSPRRTRGHAIQRPQSTVVYQKTLVPVEPISSILPGTSPHSHFDSSFFEERLRSDSMGSRSSRTSKHSDVTDGGPYQNLEIITSPEHSSFSVRSQTPETPVSITEEDPMDMEKSDYLPMTPGQRSMTPSPTRGLSQKDRSTASSDYLPMTPTRGSGTPSPTRFLERLGSVSSEPQDISLSEGYMDMRPGSVVSSPASNSSGYIDMMPGQRTPTDPGPGYMIMDAGRTRGTAPIPIRNTKEVGYMDMGPSSQTLPTVKEGGSGEAYLPMSPAGQSPLSSEGLKPAKVFSYFSDDSMSGEFPKRAYSVGSRPTPKPTHRQHPIESIRRQPLDSSKSSSAPHLILQKSRVTNADPYNKDYMDMSSNASSLNQSLRSDDTDSFMEMDFYRPRTASDSYGCRPRSSSFGKQVYQGHRPRSSSYGQSSKLSKLVTSNRVDSFESVRRASQDFMRKRSQESLSKHSCSSSESLKKFSEDVQKKASIGSDYMDMGFDKSKDTSPVVHGIGSPVDPTGYVDMTLGSSAPKHQRGISPSSSSHSLGSSPASGYGHQEKSHDSTKIVHPSGKISQKQGFKPSHPSPHSTEQQLKVATARLKQSDKRSPASSGKESEDESYVPFQPGSVSDKQGSQLSGSHDFIFKTPPGIKIQHGYSRSYDSAVKPVESLKKSKSSKHKKDDKKKEVVPKQNKSGRHEKHEKESKGNKEKDKNAVNSKKDNFSPGKSANVSLQEKVALGHSPTIERKIDYIPDTDLFSNSIFTKSSSTPDKSFSKTKGDDSGYMEYLPGLEGDLSSSMQHDDDNSVAKTQDIGEKELAKDLNKVSLTSPQSINTDLKTDIKRNEVVLPQSKVDTSVSDYILSDPVSVSDYMLSDPVSVSDYMLSDPVSVSDYMLSDPASNVAVASEGATLVNSNSNTQNEVFSYMDFDPASKTYEDKSSVKSPTQVKSFFVSEDMLGEKEYVLKQEKCNESNKCSTSFNSHCEENSGNCSVGDSEKKGSKVKLGSNNRVQEGENARKKSDDFRSSKVDGIDCMKGDNKTVIDKRLNDSLKEKTRKTSKSSAEEIKAKFVVLKKSEQEVMDEGYIELDFSNHSGKEQKKHHRSGSSSSTASIASDKSRKGTDTGIEEVIPSPSPIVSYINTQEEDLPRPQIPLSYICDNVDSDPKLYGGLKDPGSPDKHGSGKTSADSDTCFSKAENSSHVFVDNSQTGEVLTTVPVQPLNFSQVSQVLSPLSRQTSVPLGPSYSPRTSEDIQSIRTRKASGPATLSVTRKTSCNTGNVVKQLEPVPTGPGVPKQINTVAMNSPHGVVDKIRVEKGQEMGQRHSYTDLSQYWETSPAGNLEKLNSGGRSNSQQQLTEVTQEKKLNYADLDLKGSSENVDEKPRVNYATINFEKTESLKNSNAKEEVKFSI